MAMPDAAAAPAPKQFVEHRNGDFLISTNPALLQANVIQHYLSQDSYWAQGIPPHIVEKSLRNSLSFGLYHAGTQIGLARVVTDFAVFAYLCDVFVLPEFRGRGLSKWLMRTVLAHPELQTVRKWMLGTKDAHGLYAQFGFREIARPERLMERIKENPYGQKGNS